MKKNLLKSLLVAGLMAVSAGAWAQTDVTTTYIKNANFKDGATGWTEVLSGEYRDIGTGLIGSFIVREGMPAATVDDSHLSTEYCAGFECRWSTNFSSYTQKTESTLPVGTYTLSFDVENTNSSTTSVNYENRFTVTIGETVFTDEATEWMKAKSSWTSHSIVFTVNEASAATISLGYGTGSNNIGSANTPVLYVSHLKLSYTSDLLAGIKGDLQKEIDAAEATAKLYGNPDALTSAIAVAKGYLDSTVAEDIEAATVTLKQAVKDYRESLLFTWDGIGYIVDAYSGLFIAAGHDWGTRAIVNETGIDITFTADEQTKTMTLDTKISDGGEKHFLGTNLYTDANAYGWKFEQFENGFFFITDGTQYISVDYNNNLVMSDTPSQWIILTADYVKEMRIEELGEASTSNPKDATFLLQNPNFNRNDQRVSAWVVSEDCTNKNLNGGNNLNNCAESYHSVFTISQTVEGAPAGTYQMTAQGFYRQDKENDTNEIVEDAPEFFINGSNVAVSPRTGTEDNMSQASDSFTNGLYTIAPIQIELQDGETLTVGIQGTAKWQWVIFDNFRLTYLGKVPTGISESQNLKAQHTNAIYNLQGQQVKNAQKGLFIRDGKKYVVR